MVPVVSPIEIKNIGGHKIKYKVDTTSIDKYNKENDEFTIFKLEHVEGNLGPGDVKYIYGYFRPLTKKKYYLEVPIEYTDEIPTHKDQTDYLILSGNGYHPLIDSVPSWVAQYESMPKSRFYNYYDNKIIQKCGISLEVYYFTYFRKSTLAI